MIALSCLTDNKFALSFTYQCNKRHRRCSAYSFLLTKMISLLFFVFIALHSVSALSICNVCLCRTNRVENVLQQNIDCSRRNISMSNFTLPSDGYSLDLSSNKFDRLQNSSLFKSTTIMELFLNDNNLKEIGANVLDFPELRILDFSFNKLESIHEDTFTNLKKLQFLNLASNKFTSFEKLAFHHLSNLKEIILDNNDIGQSLRKVNLFDINGFGLTKNIQNISMYSVNLNEVPDNFFIEAYDIRKLVISNNNLSGVFEFPYTLEYLDLSDNPIKTISTEDFNNIPALRVLKLNNLEIEEVPCYVFEPLHGLKELEIERNKYLTNFSRLAFGDEALNDPDNFLLEQLSLKNSRLTTLDEDLLEPFGRLIKLDLQGNPWKCDCKIAWFKQLQIDPKDYEHLR